MHRCLGLLKNIQFQNLRNNFQAVPPPELPPADRPILPRPPALAPKLSSAGSRHSPPLPPRVPPARDPGDYPTNVKPLNPREPYENNETLRKVRHSHDNIPFESIHVKDAIGEGEFGSVYKAVYMNEKGMIRWGSLNQSLDFASSLAFSQPRFSLNLKKQRLMVSWFHCSSESKALWKVEGT